MNRYLDAALNDPADDIPTIRSTMTHLLTLRDGKRPRTPNTQIAVLEALSKYDLGQVIEAAYVFQDRNIPGDGRVTWPFDRYFLGMVRGDAGGYQRHKEKEERNAEAQKRTRRTPETHPETRG